MREYQEVFLGYNVTIFKLNSSSLIYAGNQLQKSSKKNNEFPRYYTLKSHQYLGLPQLTTLLLL